MTKAAGRYPLSTNMGAADKWLDKDGVPRPDRTVNTLKWMQILVLPGLLGLDHFYLRSPITGIIKMLTVGGLGFWYLWDVCQIWSERERVIKYGLTTPFDFYTGIGQGMITEVSSYKTEASYPLWLIGVLFGFLGIDAMVALNWGQALRKILEFALFLLCLGYVFSWGSLVTGWIGWVTAIVCGTLLGMIIIAEWLSVIGAVFGGDLFRAGVEFTKDEDEQYNGLFRWLIDNTKLSDELKTEIKEYLKYGGISAEDLKKRYGIKYPSEMDSTPTESTSDSSKKPLGSVPSFIFMILSPLLIIVTWIVTGIKWIIEMATGRGLASVAGNVAGLDLKNPLAGLQKAAGAGGLGGILTSASGSGTGGVGSLLTAASGSGTGGLGGLLTAAGAPASMTGGAREDSLSTEAQLMGAALIAIIAGGSLKGLVDYLMKK